jgi:uncharacterized protein (DUF4415 family)
MKISTRNGSEVLLDRPIDEDMVDMPEVRDFTAWRPASERNLHRMKKVPVTLQLDEDIAAWLKENQGGTWLISVNSQLRKIMEHFKKSQTQTG